MPAMVSRATHPKIRPRIGSIVAQVQRITTLG
jgi:hypothetical protein